MMKRIVKLIIFVSLSLLSSCGHKDIQTIDFNAVEKSVVRVLCYDYDKKTLLVEGSGFFVDANGSFVTNAHVIEDAYFVKIQTFDGKEYDCKDLDKYNYKSSDYALGSIKLKGNSYLKKATEVKKDETVYGFGFPNSSKKVIRTEGKVVNTSIVDSKTNVEYIENTAPIDHGSSGGPLLNSSGQLIGITTGKLDNNNYGAVNYLKIYDELFNGKDLNKEPLEYFHNVLNARLWEASDVNTYFDWSVDNTGGVTSSHMFEAQIRLKSIYLNKKIILDSKITINIGTSMFYYYTIQNSVTTNSDLDMETIRFVFNEPSQLKTISKGYSKTSIGATNYVKITSVKPITGIESCTGFFRIID